MVIVRIQNSNHFCGMPLKATAGSSGYDLYSYFEGVIMPGERMAVPTGIYLDLPDGYEAQVRGRSGLALNKGILVHFGTVDSDYKGEVKVIMFNTSKFEYRVEIGDRIAQLVFAPVYPVEIQEVVKVDGTRGGFGSTGR